ncbi:ribonuclease H-like family [Trichomonas vaginalis G3]|uniref:ribonuclease H-like family n=1 Tax=Trichomonas vaginalis (strain ATCC PRA-98 / G3) TaxID=412133 RepID=UPI0021E5330B|nr:ribonuclease H-like family [Trichomonas vaginalis G3]KAI5552327.1 ribonuclease H-like family [Trichomonas vaginalis G3]
MNPYKGYVDRIYLIGISNQIEEGKMTWEEACTHVPIAPTLQSNDFKYLDVSKSFLQNQFSLQNIPLPKGKKGRRVNPYDQIKALAVIHDHWVFPCGQTKQWKRLKLQQIDVSYREVRRYFKENHFTKTRLEHAGPETAVRYWALSPNLIWHADVHYFRGVRGQYIYGIIDDFSRKVLACIQIQDMLAATTANVAASAFIEFGAPYCFWTDNGSENRGAFQDLLDLWGVQWRHTDSHSPYQNGKIERFWPTLERCQSIQAIPAFIWEYNNNTPHEDLPINPLTGTNYTPNQMYQLKPKYTNADTERLWQIWDTDTGMTAVDTFTA